MSYLKSFIAGGITFHDESSPFINRDDSFRIRTMRSVKRHSRVARRASEDFTGEVPGCGRLPLDVARRRWEQRRDGSDLDFKRWFARQTSDRSELDPHTDSHTLMVGFDNDRVVGSFLMADKAITGVSDRGVIRYTSSGGAQFGQHDPAIVAGYIRRLLEAPVRGVDDDGNDVSTRLVAWIPAALESRSRWALGNPGMIGVMRLLSDFDVTTELDGSVRYVTRISLPRR
jgi:hypothetical protein